MNIEFWYYAVAENKKGKIEQCHCITINGRTVKQAWTGIFYPSMKVAMKELSILNDFRKIA